MARQLPARVDPELYAYLKDLQARVASLESAGSAEEESDSGGVISGSTSSFGWVYESAADPLEDEGSGTEGAWTSLASGVPQTATFAIIQFSFLSTDGNTDATMKFRKASGSQEIKAGQISPGTGDAEANRFDQICLVELDSSGSFEYNVTISAGDGEWDIVRLGYIA